MSDELEYSYPESVVLARSEASAKAALRTENLTNALKALRASLENDDCEATDPEDCAHCVRLQYISDVLGDRP